MVKSTCKQQSDIRSTKRTNPKKNYNLIITLIFSDIIQEDRWHWLKKFVVNNQRGFKMVHVSRRSRIFDVARYIYRRIQIFEFSVTIKMTVDRLLKMTLLKMIHFENDSL
jgi:hypothetical protein